MKIGFYFRHSHANTEMVWVSAKELDNLWKSSGFDYIKSWDGEPDYTWFLPNTNLIIPEISITTSNNCTEIIFNNGMHRTRWLIEQGLAEIPVGLPLQQIEFGKEIGLITRDFENQEFVEINDEAIGDALLKRQESIKNADDPVKQVEDFFKDLRSR